MAAHILSPIASFNTYILETQLHPTYLPFAILPCVHAARVSLAYRGITSGARKAYKLQTGNDAIQPTWVQDLAGYLIMAWGGGFLSSYLVHVIPIQLVSIYPFLNYVGVHYLIGALLTILPAPSASLLDTLLPLLDGATRAHAIFIGLSLPKTLVASGAPSTVTSSWLLPLLLATIAASGGGQLAGTLGAFSPTGWALTLPPCLSARTWLACVDIWAPFLGALSYCFLTASHPIYYPAIRLVHAGKEGPILSHTGAKAVTTLVVAAAFAWRAMELHWSGTLPVQSKSMQPAKASSRIGNGKKKQ